MKQSLWGLVLLVFLAGCVYVENWDRAHRSWVGTPVSEYVEVNGPPDQAWKRGDGNTIYKYHFKRLDPTCIHYWVVDEQGIIKDLYHEGHCVPIG